MSSGESGSKYSAASPQTSGSEVAFDAATGQPHAIASSGGSPKPSYRLGKTRQRGAAVQLDELVRRDVAARLDAVRQPRAFVALPRQDEPQLRPLSPYERERLEQALVVLVRPAVGGVEEERLTLRPSGVNRSWSMPRWIVRTRSGGSP